MIRVLLVALALVTAAGSASARSVSFDGFGGLFYFDGPDTVAVEDQIFGNLDTGRGSPFFELIMAGPHSTVSFDIFGTPLAGPLLCFGNNSVGGAGIPDPACVTDPAHVDMNYALVVDDLAENASLSIYAATGKDPTAFFAGTAGTERVATSFISMPLPGAFGLMFGVLIALGLITAPTRRTS